MHNLFHIQWIIVPSEHWAVVLLVNNMVFTLKLIAAKCKIGPFI